MFLKKFLTVIALAGLFTCPGYAQEPTSSQSVLFNFKSGQMASFDKPQAILKWNGPDTFQSTELFERDFGFVQELVGGKSISFNIDWQNGARDPELFLTTIGYPENSASELLVKENSGSYRSFPAGPSNKLTQIKVPLQELKTGLNTITIGLKKGFLGLQIIELRFSTLLKGFPVGNGELFLTNSSLNGQSLEKGRTVWVSWSISDSVSPEALISFQYKTNKGAYRYIREASNILVSYPNTDPTQVISSGKFRWNVPEDIASLDLKVIAGKAEIPPVSLFSNYCANGTIPLEDKELYDALLQAANSNDCVEAEDNLYHLNDLSLAEKGIQSLKLLADFKNLKQLNLAGNPVKNIGALSALTNLESLSLAECQLTGISEIEKILSLRILDVSGNHLTQADGLANLPKLTDLDLSNNELTAVDGLLSKPYNKFEFENNYLCANGRSFEAIWEEFISNGKLRYLCSNGQIVPKDTICKPGFVASDFRCVKPAACPGSRGPGEEFGGLIPGGNSRFRCEIDGTVKFLETKCEEGFALNGQGCEAKVVCEGTYKTQEVVSKKIANGQATYLCQGSGVLLLQTVSCDVGYQKNMKDSSANCVSPSHTSYLQIMKPNANDFAARSGEIVIDIPVTRSSLSGPSVDFYTSFSIQGHSDFQNNSYLVEGTSGGFSSISFSTVIASLKENSVTSGRSVVARVDADVLVNSAAGSEFEIESYCTGSSIQSLKKITVPVGKNLPEISRDTWIKVQLELGSNFWQNLELANKGCENIWLRIGGINYSGQIRVNSITWGQDVI